jgi:hypothetical protein
MPTPVSRQHQSSSCTTGTPHQELDPPAELECAEPVPIKSDLNKFGLYRLYPEIPSSVPNQDISLDSVCDAPGLSVSDHNPEPGGWLSGLGSLFSGVTSKNLFAPFENSTIFRLINWHYGCANSKSMTDLDALVKDVIMDENFDKNHLQSFSAAREFKCLDDFVEGPGPQARDGWNEASVFIRLPAERVKHSSESDAPLFEVPGIFYRRLIEVVKSVFESETAKSFQLTPFCLFWKRSDDHPEERIYTDVYNSDAMVDEHDRIKSSPPNPEYRLETIIAAIMVWSDSTHLANFGTALLWPIYAFFGNQSKYTRGKPTSIAAHHIAYIHLVRHHHRFPICY